MSSLALTHLVRVMSVTLRHTLSCLGCLCAQVLMHVCEQRIAALLALDEGAILSSSASLNPNSGWGFPHQPFSWVDQTGMKRKPLTRPHEEEAVNEAPCSHVFVISCLAQDRSVLWSEFSSCGKEIRITWCDWAFYVNELWESACQGAGGRGWGFWWGCGWNVTITTQQHMPAMLTWQPWTGRMSQLFHQCELGEESSAVRGRAKHKLHHFQISVALCCLKDGTEHTNLKSELHMKLTLFLFFALF